MNQLICSLTFKKVDVRFISVCIHHTLMCDTFPAGTMVRNVEGTSKDADAIKRKLGVQSWITLICKQSGFDKRDLHNCACYNLNVCKLGKKKGLFGCHCKLDDDPAVYIVPMCPTHNGMRASGNQLTATHEFYAYKLPAEHTDKQAVLLRVQTHLNILRADLTELKPDDDILDFLQKEIERMRL